MARYIDQLETLREIFECSDLFLVMDSLVGKKVRIRAIKMEGSARLLNGLTATVVAPHPFAVNWLLIDLDPNSLSPHRRWSIAADRLVPCESDLESAGAGALRDNFGALDLRRQLPITI